jgi:hypothetical protein
MRALDATGSGYWRRGALDAVGSSAKAKAALGAACAVGEARVMVEKKEENISIVQYSAVAVNVNF